MYIFRVVIISLLLSQLLISCNVKSKGKKFAELYELNAYDTIYVVSCMSCGGCVLNFLDETDMNAKKLVIYDEECGSKFARDLKKYRHKSVAQSELDKWFDNFGNIMILMKRKDDYIMEPYPD